MKPKTDGWKSSAGHAATSPAGRIADNGSEARGSAHGYFARSESSTMDHTLP